MEQFHDLHTCNWSTVISIRLVEKVASLYSPLLHGNDVVSYPFMLGWGFIMQPTSSTTAVSALNWAEEGITKGSTSMHFLIALITWSFQSKRDQCNPSKILMVWVSMVISMTA
jgi:hypothetical protein